MDRVYRDSHCGQQPRKTISCVFGKVSRKVWVILGGRRESVGYLKGKCKVGGGKVWVSSLYGWLWFQSYGFSTKHGCLLHVFLVETKG